MAPGSGFSVWSVMRRKRQMPSPVTQTTVLSIGLKEHSKTAFYALLDLETAPTLAFSQSQ